MGGERGGGGVGVHYSGIRQPGEELKRTRTMEEGEVFVQGGGGGGGAMTRREGEGC